MPKTKSHPSKTQALASASPEQEPLTPADRISRALHYHRRAESASHQMAVWGALAGLEIQSLKNEQGHGAWTEFYAFHIEALLPLRTAQYYMTVAEGLKLKARRAADGEITFAPSKADLDAFLAKRTAQVAAGRLVQLTGHFERRYSREVWTLLQTPPHRLSDAQRARLAAAVESIADGETMGSLIEAYRLSKQAVGTGVKGGTRIDPAVLAEFLGAYHAELLGTAYEALPAEVQAHFRKWAAQRLRDPAQMAFNFCKPMLDAFEDPEFEATVRALNVAEKQRLRDHAAALVLQLDAELKPAVVARRAA